MTAQPSSDNWYWDGQQWHSAPVPPPAGVIVSGPNHALHAIATLLTWPLCGGWAWVWLFVAANNRKTVQTVDAYGRVIEQPKTQKQLNIEAENRKGLMIGAAIVVSIIVIVMIMGAL